MKTYQAGIDVGSTTVKLVVLDENENMIFGQYQRHLSHTQRALSDLLKQAHKVLGECALSLRATGSGAINLAKALGVPFVQEVVAVAQALERAAPQVDVAIELGGEDAKIIYFKGGLEERMNGVCAGGRSALRSAAVRGSAGRGGTPFPAGAVQGNSRFPCARGKRALRISIWTSLSACRVTRMRRSVTQSKRSLRLTLRT